MSALPADLSPRTPAEVMRRKRRRAWWALHAGMMAIGDTTAGDILDQTNAPLLAESGATIEAG